MYFLLFKVLHVSFFPPINISLATPTSQGQAPTTTVSVSIDHANIHSYKSFGFCPYKYCCLASFSYCKFSEELTFIDTHT